MNQQINVLIHFFSRYPVVCTLFNWPIDQLRLKTLVINQIDLILVLTYKSCN